jgi:hypothetical protein
MTRRLTRILRGALLLGALLALAACASTPDRAPGCHGPYTPINTPDHYPTPEKKAP